MPKINKVHAFTEADLHRWERRFESDAPTAPQRPATDCPQVISFRGQDSAYGLGVRLKLETGDEIDLMLNPVVARALAIQVMNTGKTKGWMADIMTISPPLILENQKKRL